MNVIAMFKLLFPICLVAGIVCAVNGLMTMDTKNMWYGAGMFVLAMTMVAALIWCPFEDDAEL
jgi:membrane protein YdbS with pleckstrin-like domain